MGSSVGAGCEAAGIAWVSNSSSGPLSLDEEKGVGDPPSTGSGVRLELDRMTDSITCWSWILSSLRIRFRWTAALRGMMGDGDDGGEKVVMREKIRWSLSNVSLSSCDESIGRQRHKVGTTKVHSETRHTVVGDPRSYF